MYGVFQPHKAERKSAICSLRRRGLVIRLFVVQEDMDDELSVLPGHTRFVFSKSFTSQATINKSHISPSQSQTPITQHLIPRT